jgi:phosphohistidine phosphatase
MMAQSCTLYLVRHAIAEDRGPEYPDDSQRPLTPRGVSRFRKVARGFASLEPGVQLILTSPYERARHTANILAEELRDDPAVVETAAMTPEAEYADLVGELGAHTGRTAIALVGHEPTISEFAARLLVCKGSVEFKKGGIARIDVPALPPSRPGRLIWVAPPRILGDLRR